MERTIPYALISSCKIDALLLEISWNEYELAITMLRKENLQPSVGKFFNMMLA